METRKLTCAAIAAKEIRNRLKVAGIPAKVRSSNFANGNSVDIDLTDADPQTVAKANTICDPFQYGHFDGMIDLYEYSNKRPDLPAQAKYVSVTNHTSPETEQRVYDFVRAEFAEARDFPASYEEASNLRIADGWVPQFVWRQFCQADSLYWHWQHQQKAG